MRAGLVPRLVAGPIWLYPGRSGRARTPARDLARRPDAAVRQCAADLCRAPGVAMDRRLCRRERGFELEPLVAPILRWRERGPTHRRRTALYGGLIPFLNLRRRSA